MGWGVKVREERGAYDAHFRIFFSYRKAIGKERSKRSNWLMGPWMLPASHTVHPPPQMVAYFLTVSPHFGTDQC